MNNNVKKFYDALDGIGCNHGSNQSGSILSGHSAMPQGVTTNKIEVPVDNEDEWIKKLDAMPDLNKSEDVEKAADNYILTSPYRYTSLTDIFKAGAEWQLKQFMEFENIKAGFFIRKGEEINTFLIAALRCLSEEQMIVLRDCIIERTPPLKKQVSNVWVSVEDDKPALATPVLIATKHWIGVGYYKKNFELNLYDEPEWSEENGEYIFGGEVTHWMPLPSPPNSPEQPINEESKIDKAIEWCQTKIKECDGFRDVASRSSADTLIEVKKYLQSLK